MCFLGDRCFSIYNRVIDKLFVSFMVVLGEGVLDFGLISGLGSY